MRPCILVTHEAMMTTLDACREVGVRVSHVEQTGVAGAADIDNNIVLWAIQKAASGPWMVRYNDTPRITWMRFTESCELMPVQG